MMRRRFGSSPVLRPRKGPAPWAADATTGPRVVVECDDFALAEAAEHSLDRAGYQVRVCGGPSRLHRCPLLDTGRCELAAGSDVVVNLMQRDDPTRAEIISALRVHHGDVSLVAEGTRDDRGVHLLESPVRRDTLLRAVSTVAAAPHA